MTGVAQMDSEVCVFMIGGQLLKAKKRTFTT